jgi:hypothetical protein
MSVAAARALFEKKAQETKAAELNAERVKYLQAKTRQIFEEPEEEKARKDPKSTMRYFGVCSCLVVSVC